MGFAKWIPSRGRISNDSLSLCIKLYQVLFQVGLKLYMFVPAIVAGTLLSISFWILAMMIIRTYGYLRKKLFPSLCTQAQDLEMNPSGKHKEAELSNVPEKIFKSDMDTILSSDREFRPTKPHHKKGFDGKRFTSEGSSSFHSSPVSLSSGIGASEDRDTGDTDSRASGETEPGDAALRPHHHGHRNRWFVTPSNSWAYSRIKKVHYHTLVTIVRWLYNTNEYYKQLKKNKFNPSWNSGNLYLPARRKCYYSRCMNNMLWVLHWINEPEFIDLESQVK